MSKVRFTARCNTAQCILEVYLVSIVTVGVEMYVHISIVFNLKGKGIKRCMKYLSRLSKLII